MRRHRSTLFARDRPKRGGDSPSNSGLRKITRNPILDFAKFGWTRLALTRALRVGSRYRPDRRAPNRGGACTSVTGGNSGTARSKWQ